MPFICTGCCKGFDAPPGPCPDCGARLCPRCLATYDHGPGGEHFSWCVLSRDEADLARALGRTRRLLKEIVAAWCARGDLDAPIDAARRHLNKGRVPPGIDAEG